MAREKVTKKEAVSISPKPIKKVQFAENPAPVFLAQNEEEFLKDKQDRGDPDYRKNFLLGKKNIKENPESDENFGIMKAQIKMAELRTYLDVKEINKKLYAEDQEIMEMRLKYLSNKVKHHEMTTEKFKEHLKYLLTLNLIDQPTYDLHICTLQ